MRTCKICENIHEARGYCKRHYRSLMKHGDANQVDINKTIAAENKMKTIEKRRMNRNYSTDGICSIGGCQNPIKARLLCDMHYTRRLRTGTTEITSKVLSKETDYCIVIDCDKENYSAGFCSTHKSYNQKFGTPYIAKTIKLCGVGACLEVHLAKGMCKQHYYQWSKVLKEYGID